MVTITSLIENILSSIALSDVQVPYYCGMPDFGDDELTDYIIYDFYEIPACFADDAETVNEYDITVSIFTEQLQNELYQAVKSAFKANNFLYQSAYPYDDKGYPPKKRVVQEYKISIPIEEEI